MITDNVASLFAPAPGGPAMTATFRVGILAAVNPDDGSNTVFIGPTELTNVPYLVTGAELGLEDGDNVLLMYLGTTVVLVGKFATVGGPNFGLGNAGRAGFRKTGLTNFGASTTGALVYSDTSITVPGWANSGLVTLIGAATVTNDSGANEGLDSQVQLACPGQALVTGTGFNVTVPNGFFGSTYSIVSDVVPLTPDQTLTINYLTGAGANFSPSASDHAEVSASVQFFRESAT